MFSSNQPGLDLGDRYSHLSSLKFARFGIQLSLKFIGSQLTIHCKGFFMDTGNVQPI